MTEAFELERVLSATVARRASALAVVDGANRLDWRGLAQRAEHLVARLEGLGVRCGDRVAILDGNTTLMLTAYFATARMHAILCPLNTRLAVPELQAVLRDTGARTLLVGERYAELARCLACEPDDEPPARDDLAQLYYTSGTTGQPKGVMLTRANVLTHARACVEHFELGEKDVWGHFAPMFHLADAWAVFAITLAGGVHVLLDRFEPTAARALLDSAGVTMTNVIPTMLRALVDVPRPQPPSALRLLLSGGAPIARSLIDRVLEEFGCEYAQTYGLTETSPFLTTSRLRASERALPRERRLTLLAKTGRAFPSVELRVVSDAGELVAADGRTVGEIQARGSSVTPGYWRQSAETAAAFDGAWLRTGDLAVTDPDGFLRIVDRRKHVIVTGGENVYAIEVENVLYEHGAVREAAVFGEPDEHWGERVVACVAADVSVAVTGAELERHCRERIAGYKVPRRFLVLDDLPKTGSGKIDKRACRQKLFRS